MIIDPEVVSVALFNLIKGATWKLSNQTQGFAYVERRPRMWTDVPAGNFPYMALAFMGATESQATVGGNPICSLSYDCWIYYQADLSRADGAPVPETVVNAILGQYGKGSGFGVRSALMPGFGVNQTLASVNNGADLVTHCWIEGTILADTYVDENPGVIKIPIQVLVGG